VSGAFPRKSITALNLQAEALEPARALPLTLSLFSLTLRCRRHHTCGRFVLTGTVAAEHAGPAAVLSYVLARVAYALR
jgi:hypothetical protein